MTTTHTAQELAPLSQYWKTQEEVEAAGFAFLGIRPVVGEQAVIFSRGNWRLGLVTHITKTGTVTVEYVTPGGITDGEKTWAHYQNLGNIEEYMASHYTVEAGYSDDQRQNIQADLERKQAKNVLDFVNISAKSSKTVAVKA